MVRDVRFGLLYDFSNPPHSGRTISQSYAETLELVELSETLGYDDVWLGEHHFTDFLVSTLAVASAIAVRTNRLSIAQSVSLVPLHNPLRLAEDTATVDILSNGRFIWGPGLGYRPIEFEGFGIEKRHRVSIFEEGLEVVVQAWTQPAVNFSGRHFNFRNVEVRPQPVQRPRPPIWIGGLSRPAIHRAARLGDGLIAGGRRAYEWYVEGLQLAGRPVTDVQIAGPPKAFIMVDEDPERLWQDVGESLLYQHNRNITWYGPSGQWSPLGKELVESWEDLKTSPSYAICTPEEAVDFIVDYLRDVPITRLWTFANLPGLDPAISRRHMETFAHKVIPEVRKRLQDTAKSFEVS
jgi:alkanesulfonate monooxygenase SsuD/methylene tetrahydromethanopterin reductase-like flavin-dependent oxidoreductase (luciferase family)